MRNPGPTLLSFDLFEELTTVVGAPAPGLIEPVVFEITWGEASFQAEDGVVLVGRAREADVRIADLTVSRRHCRIHREGSHFVIEDLGSTHGVIVNGEKVKTATLNGDETLFIGRVEVHLIFGAAAQAG